MIIYYRNYGGNFMHEIKRSDINEEWAHSGIVEAGDFVFINYCVGNLGQSIEKQINGAFDHLSKRLESIGLTFEAVVKMDCLFSDIKDIPIMEKVIKERFNGKYPARKSFQNFGWQNPSFQIDAIAFKG